MNKLFDDLKKPTEYKSPAGNDVFTIPDLKESDFEEAPYIPDQPINNSTPEPNQAPGQFAAPAPEPARVFDPDFTTDAVIDSIDTLQYPLFLLLNQKKQKRLRFKDDNEYREAVRLQYLTDGELHKMFDNGEDTSVYLEKKLLIDKYKAYQEVITKLSDKIGFTPDETERLKKPIKQMVKQSNFDLPPWLALTIVMGDILSNRVIDLIMD